MLPLQVLRPNWAAVNSATSYQLDVATATDFSTLVSGFINLTVNGTTQAVTGLTSGTTYILPDSRG